MTILIRQFPRKHLATLLFILAQYIIFNAFLPENNTNILKSYSVFLCRGNNTSKNLNILCLIALMLVDMKVLIISKIHLSIRLCLLGARMTMFI